MCGRYVSPDQAAIEREWQIGRANGNPFPRVFNVAPTNLVPIMRLDRESHEIELTAARWGLIPHWWKDTKLPAHTINARSEDAATKPMWRTALRNWRCLIPAEGWYEWKQDQVVDRATGEVKPSKQPYFIHRKDQHPFCFAGLTSLWTPEAGGDPVLSCSILTKDAARSVADVHDRMPVVLPTQAHATWLDPELTDSARVGTIMRECAMADFESYPVSARVNSTRNNDEKLLEPVAG
jgi:putative SOS response-associated peptidase YedK